MSMSTERPAAAPAVVPDLQMRGPILNLRHGPDAKLVRGLVGIMAMVREISKEGRNKEQGYDYVSRDDVFARCQDAMVQNGIMMIPREVSRRIIQKVLFITYDYDFYHAEGESIVNAASHTGACRFEFKSGAVDDKAANKCYTTAQKHCLMTTFKIPSDDTRVERTEEPDGQGSNYDPGEPRSPQDGDRREPARDEGRRDPPRDDERRGPSSEDDRRDDRRRDPRDDDRRDRRDDERRDPRDGRRGSDGIVYPPSGGADASPPMDGPPLDQEELEHRRKIKAFSNDLAAALTFNDALAIWRGAEGGLLTEAADKTYQHLRSDFEARWQRWPETPR